MGDHDDGLPLFIDLCQKFHHDVRRAGVQGTGRFVCQQKFRPGDQSSGCCCALLLAAGDLIRVLFQQFADSQILRQRGQAGNHLFVWCFLQNQRKKDIVLQRQRVQQIEILEYETEMIPAETGHLFLRDLGDIPAVQQNLTACRPVQRSEDIQQGGFS